MSAFGGDLKNGNTLLPTVFYLASLLMLHGLAIERRVKIGLDVF